MLEPFNIRPMTFDDLDEVYRIETTAHVTPWSRGIIHDCIDVGYGCFVIEWLNSIVGYTIVRVAAGECHILNICVKPEKQGSGLGKRLLKYIFEMAKPFCEKIILEVRVSNLPAIGLYKKFGFEQCGYRKDYYPFDDGSREDAIVLHYELKNKQK